MLNAIRPMLWAGLLAWAGVPALAHAETLTHGSFTVEYGDAVPAEAALMIAQRTDAAVAIVTAYLNQANTYAGPPYDTPLRVVITAERFIPYQRGSTIEIPEARVLNIHSGATDQRTDLGIIHEITHVYAASYNRENRDRFYDDGLAVFLQHRFGFEPNYPNFGEDLYVATARAAAAHGELIPLAITEETRNRNETRVARRLAYLQEGAFTQFLIERFGLETYFRIYHGTPIEEATGHPLADLEADWAALIAATPVPAAD